MIKVIMRKKYIIIILLFTPLLCLAEGLNKTYSLWYQRPAFNRGGDYNTVKAHGYPFDEDWERWSLPIGNGYMGANVFGRTDVERIQLSEKTLGNRGCYGNGGFTSFAEIYLDIFHTAAKDYKRELCLNNALSSVVYEYEGVRYSREYLASYPNNIIAVKLKADKPKSLTFRVRPILPYLRPTGAKDDGRTGQVFAKGDMITMEGEIQYFKLAYEAQIKVLNYGGNTIASNDEQNDHGVIMVNQADSVVLFIAAGTSYHLDENTFLVSPIKKFEGNEHPHRMVSERIEKAAEMGYESIRATHIADYRHYIDRVDINLANEIPKVPTDILLSNYRDGNHSRYLEELFFQFGRYLLISSSRAGTLPPNLQGGWNQYEYAPWSGGYWHNINIQMNYWPAFNTNLAELFQPFIDYNEAYRKKAQFNATDYVKKNNPSELSVKEDGNGWAVGTGATAFAIHNPGGHSGPGTGGFTTKLFWDYYDFTRDRKVLEEHVYPALLGMAKFLSKTLHPMSDGTLLTIPSSSPEQRHRNVHYQTKGCTFDQGMIWECFHDLLETAKILKKKDLFLKVIEEQIVKLDPVHIGASGQLKEYREENEYGEIGDPAHRHISHLCLLYPGTLINNNTPEWMTAARIALEKRKGETGNWKSWPMAHRMNAWARAKNGNKAYLFYQLIISKVVAENLWSLCPPFQIDGNLGSVAGVAEMLLQSHEGYIEPLAALPDEWIEGSYKGLVARGNFEVSVDWKEGKACKIEVLSKKGEKCRVKYNDIARAHITDRKGERVKCIILDANKIEFNTKTGEKYFVELD